MNHVAIYDSLKLEGQAMKKEKYLIILANCLSYLPEKVCKFAIKNVCFVTMAKATLKESTVSFVNFDNPNVKGKKGIIIFPEKFWGFDEIGRVLIIAHEVAHAYENHLEKSLKVEIEADKLALQWLHKHFDEQLLLTRCAYHKRGI